MADMQKRELRVRVGSGLRLAADAWGKPSDRPVVLLHGGGQTRFAWGGTAERLAAADFYAVSVDMRGHGESDWSDEGEYMPHQFAEDIHGIIQTFDEPPALVGASLGGMVAMLTEGELYPGSTSAVVLVDVTPRLETDGVDRIHEFMTGNPDGFASIDEAAAAVAEYLPHRPRPSDNSGLAKNLRLGEDGRYRWHWDPRFLMRARRTVDGRKKYVERLMNAVASLTVPTLLVRGRMSDIVSPETAKEFLELVPHAEYVDVEDAAHMVAGDKNDVFANSVVDFLTRHLIGSRSSAA